MDGCLVQQLPLSFTIQSHHQAMCSGSIKTHGYIRQTLIAVVAEILEICGTYLTSGLHKVNAKSLLQWMFGLDVWPARMFGSRVVAMCDGNVWWQCMVALYGWPGKEGCYGGMLNRAVWSRWA